VTPLIARAIVIAVAAVAVLIAAAGRDGAKEPQLAVHYIYSTDATKLLVPLIDRFNSETHLLGGREVRIVGEGISSGQAEAALAAGEERAALWTPASSMWGGLLNHRVSAEWVPAGKPVSLVYSPQVIAMWASMADALGYPEKKIGWKDILDLATSTRSWEDYGHPEYGRFLLGHTNPGYSTSGLSAVASDYYAVTGKRSGLTLADVRQPEGRDRVRTIERSIVHYGETADNMIEKMLLYRRGYAHAVYVQETSLRKLPRKQGAKLVAIDPADGTFVADYPLYVLDAPWVSADARAAAEEFRRWLAPKITAKNATENGFDIRRPTVLAELEPPEPEALAAMRDAWHDDRKPANIVVVMDTSNSMDASGRLEAAQQGLVSFLQELSREDRFALITSGDAIETNVPLDVLGERGPAVARAITNLFPAGDEPVYPAVREALESLRELDDRGRINAVVVLSDGAGTDLGREELLRTIAAEPVTEGTGVRIFTVAYGKSPDTKALQEIASQSEGVFFSGGPNDIDDVYRRILSYF
jgi:Ca-activated chloride channel homolog